MKICENGHIFDEKKHLTCPYCDEPVLTKSKDFVNVDKLNNKFDTGKKILTLRQTNHN